MKPVWAWKISVGDFRIYLLVLRRKKTSSKTVSLFVDNHSFKTLEIFRFC